MCRKFIRLGAVILKDAIEFDEGPLVLGHASLVSELAPKGNTVTVAFALMFHVC